MRMKKKIGVRQVGKGRDSWVIGHKPVAVGEWAVPEAKDEKKE